MKWGIFLIIFLFISCLPEERAVNRAASDNTTSNSTDTSTDTEIADQVTIDSTVSWLNSGISSNVLTVNFDNTKTVYLFGDQVNNFLSNSDNFSGDYCMEVRFNTSSSNTINRLRVKLSSAISNNFSQGQISRYFRVNLGTEIGNDFCNRNSIENVNGTDTLIIPGDSDYDGDDDSSDTEIVFQTSDVCPDCRNIISSSEVILYQRKEARTSSLTSSDYLKRIELNNIDYAELVMRIDLNSNSDNGQSSCNDNACKQQGFDCCVEGQCIDEKTIKVSGVLADPDGFTVAEQEKFSDPNWFKRYPQFYFSCLEAPPAEPEDPAEPDDPIGDADERLAQLTSDYTCLTELDDTSESDPFHIDFINGNPTCGECGGDATCTQEVMERLYDNCGCVETDLISTIQTCPAYTYQPVFQTGSDGQPTTTVLAYECKTPEVAETPLPFSDLEVRVSSRSAPHRFFNEDNVEIDPTQALEDNVSETQEGEEFKYLDDFYIFPRNNDFNMNSILGQMTVQLDQARPAVTIDLEFDKQYLISTRNGSYISCPNCARDSWFSNFSPFPNAQDGVGIQAIGYTTRRDTFETNITLGNYVDTKFNRACYLPPTMLPFSQDEKANNQDQRLNRLQTQAALYVNGYQKDWYGFNRGALIGSFDGVTWFAIGKGRRVRATSNKLFLAINGPFADLASPSEHTVAVQEYDFVSSAPLYDFDPEEEINSSFQNEAGSCQFWHQCETDTDCITRLGWEYSCADVSLQRTKWPNFNPLGASELPNESREGTIAQFLQQATLPPGSSTKRCVYRGAGAPCRVDYENISDEGVRKHLTCAPNFYCERLTTSRAFNSEVARFGRPLDELVESKNHFFGMDANILGRPKHYINENNLVSLPDDVQETLEENLLLMDAGGTSNFGLCRPGKKLPDYNGLVDTNGWEYSEQHADSDRDQRTDFISQIAGCNSALYTDLRYSSCPMLDSDGNYVQTQDSFINNNFTIEGSGSGLDQRQVTERLTYSQNACGLESLSDEIVVTTATDADTLSEYSAFRTIEAGPLSDSTTIIEETLARDACFRKAGAVCHTDLDCSPNRLMAEKVDLVDLSFFGNEAERSYYEEYLICGQAEQEPSAGDSDYFSYDMSNNRCCREVGKDLTMYTEDSPNAEESQGLLTHVFGSLDPTNESRYSRYSSADATVNTVLKQSNLIRPTANADDLDNDGNLDNSTNITNLQQWRTVHSTAAKTCCGGGWVRKFEDGTNDWSVVNRLNFNLSNFQCLNYRSSLYLTENAAAHGLSQAEVDRDKIDFCNDASFNASGCIQFAGDDGIQPITDLSDFSRPVINTNTTTQRISTNTEVMQELWGENRYAYRQLQSNVDGSFSPFLDWENGADDVQKRYLSVRLPTNIVFQDIDDIQIFMTEPDSPLAGTNNPQGTERIQCINITTPDMNFNCGTFLADPINGDTENGGLCHRPGVLPVDEALWSSPGGVSLCQPGDGCCFVYNEANRILSVGYDSQITADEDAYGKFNHYLEIEGWHSPGTAGYEIDYVTRNSGGDASDPTMIDGRRSATPGSALYYLTRLAKFEYLGIPQMTYEPIYCNDNYQNLVPGIFKEEVDGLALKTVMDFINHPRTFTNDNVSKPWVTDTAAGSINAESLNQNLTTTQELVERPQIFSDNQFKCCLELGSAIDADGDPTMCCSGFAADDAELKAERDSEGINTDNEIYCKLPAGTDLNVYYNKFVSGEGLRSDQGYNPLTDEDFDAETGEPEVSADVVGKLVALGERYCQNNATRRGAVIGNFQAQPTGSQGQQGGGIDVTSLADNINDNGTANNVRQGATIYSLGFKWNHHIYCDAGTGN